MLNHRKKNLNYPIKNPKRTPKKSKKPKKSRAPCAPLIQFKLLPEWEARWQKKLTEWANQHPLPALNGWSLRQNASLCFQLSLSPRFKVSTPECINPWEKSYPVSITDTHFQNGFLEHPNGSRAIITYYHFVFINISDFGCILKAWNCIRFAKRHDYEVFEL